MMNQHELPCCCGSGGVPPRRTKLCCCRGRGAYPERKELTETLSYMPGAHGSSSHAFAEELGDADASHGGALVGRGRGGGRQGGGRHGGRGGNAVHLDAAMTITERLEATLGHGSHECMICISNVSIGHTPPLRAVHTPPCT